MAEKKGFVAEFKEFIAQGNVMETMANSGMKD